MPPTRLRERRAPLYFGEHFGASARQVDGRDDIRAILKPISESISLSGQTTARAARHCWGLGSCLSLILHTSLALPATSPAF